MQNPKHARPNAIIGASDSRLVLSSLSHPLSLAVLLSFSSSSSSSAASVTDYSASAIIVWNAACYRRLNNYTGLVHLYGLRVRMKNTNISCYGLTCFATDAAS